LSIIRKLWKNDYFKTVIAISLIVAIILSFFFGLQLVLGSSSPLRVVESGSMCVPYGGLCEGWSHPFDQTLHKGDILIIQAVSPEDLSANYPHSDIIVFRNPNNLHDPSATPIVHRIVEKFEIDGTWYFQTKGDGNGQRWPAAPSPVEYDSWVSGQDRISEDLVLGKVVMRIPWFGHVTLFMRSNPYGLPLVISLIILLVVIEFIVPIFRDKKQQAEQQSGMPSESIDSFINNSF
jgi:hypothetical protein